MMDLLQHRAFQIDVPTDDFDPNFIPEDGIQYLQQVAHERSRCPDVVIRPFPGSSHPEQAQADIINVSWVRILIRHSH